MSMYGGTKSVLSQSVAGSGATSGIKTAAAITAERKHESREEKKLDRIAAEAQAFLLNN